MPSHALPRGPAGRERRWAARKRRWRRWRESMPLMAVMMTAWQVAGPIYVQRSFARQLLAMLGGSVVVAAIVVVLALVYVAVGSWARRARVPRVGPRPRWQYLALSAAWLALAAVLVLISRHSGDGGTWQSRTCFAAGEWSGLAGLVMLGRGALWGRVRGMFWWHRPAWLLDPPRSTAP